MTTQAIIERIRQKDWTLLEEDGAIGPEAAPAIRPLLGDDDPEIRELAVHCLAAAGDGQGREGVLEALRNDSEMARSAACRCLEANPDPQDLPQLTVEVTSNPDAFVRESVARALGVIGDANATEALKRQIATEVDPADRHAMALALARLNEPAYRGQYLARLHQGEPAERARAVGEFPYVGGRDLLGELLPLLDDTEEALNVGPSNVKRKIRVCDVVVNVLDAMLDHPFSFPTGRRIRYSQAQLDEAKQRIGQGR